MPNCPKKADRYGKRRNCPKWLYIRENGSDKRMSAKTRTWERAEQARQAGQDKRDPVKRRLQEIEEQEVHKADLQKAKNITVAEAVDRWLRSVKIKTAESSAICGRAAAASRCGRPIGRS
jgi:hypothetical protein